MKISIVIPVYNGERHIKKCLESLLSQSYRDWEAVCVNDGSKDSSLELLNQFARSDSRILVYDQTNKGVVIARDLGVRNSTGDCLSFLDVDDTLEPDALAKLALVFEEASCPDIVVFGMNLVANGRIIQRKEPKKFLLDGVGYLKMALTGNSQWSLSGKLYRKELLSAPLVLPEGMKAGEDTAVAIQLICHSKRIVGYDECLYNYVQHADSVSHNPLLYDETIKSALFIEDYLRSTAYYTFIKDEISCMYLLKTSRLFARYSLPKNHAIVTMIRKNHLRFKTLCMISPVKAIFILLYIYFNWIPWQRLIK